MKISTRTIFLTILIFQILLLEVIDSGRQNKKRNSCTCKSKRKKNSQRLKREVKRLEFKDCGTDPMRPVHFLSAHASPMPVVIPGKLSFSVKVNVSRPLQEDFGLTVQLQRYLFKIPFTLPCFNSYYDGIDVGSCTYSDVCERINNWVEENGRCPDDLVQRNIPCTCPVMTGLYHLDNVMVNIPRIYGLMSYLAQGDFKVKAHLFDWITRQELGCLEMEWSIKRKRRRKDSWWSFG